MFLNNKLTLIFFLYIILKIKKMQNLNNCSFQEPSTEAIVKKRNALVAISVGIIAGYTCLIAFFIRKNELTSDNSLLILIISLFFSMISIGLIIGAEWQKLTKQLNRRP